MKQRVWKTRHRNVCPGSRRCAAASTSYRETKCTWLWIWRWPEMLRTNKSNSNHWCIPWEMEGIRNNHCRQMVTSCCCRSLGSKIQTTAHLPGWVRCWWYMQGKTSSAAAAVALQGLLEEKTKIKSCRQGSGPTQGTAPGCHDDCMVMWCYRCSRSSRRSVHAA